uniref:Uncharacterized protein n=1 Tax=Aegilops tauschii TaxID=37682 RepID=M8BAZ7_AEGTA
MALTAFETAEQRLPCHAEQADAGGQVAAAAAAEQAVPLQEADHGGRLERDDIWNMIQSQKPAAPALTPKQAPYVPAPDEGKNHAQEADQQQADEQTHEEEEDDDGEEEVQVVDRGTVVEVKVSTQPQAHNSGARVHRSSLVINKFVGAEPVNASEINDTAAAPQQPPKPPSSSEAAAPAVSATATLPDPEDDGTAATPCEGKVLMTMRRRRSKQELLNHMRRCGQLSGQLFIWEPRVATSS